MVTIQFILINFYFINLLNSLATFKVSQLLYIVQLKKLIQVFVQNLSNFANKLLDIFNHFTFTGSAL
jgi:hypothetical protein